MDRLIVRMLPPAVRASHGDELEDMLAGSSRPIRDRADVIVAGIGLRLGRALRPVLVATLAFMVASAFGMVHAIRNLQYGAVEIPHHWWSTFMAAAFAGSIVAAITVVLAQRRAAAWSRPR